MGWGHWKGTAVRVRLTGTRATYVRVTDPARLRESRELKHLTLRDAAMLIGRDHSYLCKLELGQVRTTSPGTAHRLVLLYGPAVRFHDLFALCGDEKAVA